MLHYNSVYGGAKRSTATAARHTTCQATAKRLGKNQALATFFFLLFIRIWNSVFCGTMSIAMYQIERIRWCERPSPLLCASRDLFPLIVHSVSNRKNVCIRHAIKIFLRRVKHKREII